MYAETLLELSKIYINIKIYDFSWTLVTISVGVFEE